jgi:hypothetical protein
LRLWFDDAEIETIALDELSKANLLPATDATDLAINIERFLERHLNVRLDQYADLPADVLGVTHFERGRPPRVEINRDLTGSALDDDDPEPGTVGRWRATLAHEAAHVLLHRILFDVDDMQRGLFREQAPPRAAGNLMRCLKRDLSFRRVSDWREFQANRGMAALLMPRTLFIAAARAALDAAGGPVTAGSPEHAALVQDLAGTFNVSRQAVSIRLDTLGILTPRAQGSLTL